MNCLRFITVLLLTVCLMSCASVDFTNKPFPESFLTKRAVAERGNWQIRGKFSVRTKDNRDAFTANFLWLEKGGVTSIKLFTFLGQQIIKVTGKDGHYILKDANGKSYSNHAADVFLEKKFGISIPYKYLRYWLFAEPFHRDGLGDQQVSGGEIEHLSENQWLVQFYDYQQVNRFKLPSKLKLSKDFVKMKIFVKKWQFF